MANGGDLPPVVGTVEQYVEAPVQRRLEWANEGDIVRIVSEEDYTEHVVSHPDYVRRVLVSENEQYEKPGGLEEVYGEGLIGASDEQWRRQRSVIKSVFDLAEVRSSYSEAIVGVVTDTITEIGDTERIDVKDVALSITLRVILRVLFGIEDENGAFEEPSRAIRDWVRDVQTESAVSDEASKEGQKRLNEAIERIIEEKRAVGDGRAVVSKLISLGPDSDANYTDRRIRDEMRTLLLTGHETTALTLTYTCFLLAGAPEAEAKLVAELDDVLHGNLPTGEDLHELEYTGLVIDEALRVYSPSDAIFRTARTDVELGGYTIAEGENVTLSQWAIHRDERWWYDPTSFRPERFETERNSPDFAYFPFGGGPHRCIGEPVARVGAKLLTAALFQEFSFDRITREFDVQPGATVSPKGPIELELENRRRK